MTIQQITAHKTLDGAIFEHEIDARTHDTALAIGTSTVDVGLMVGVLGKAEDSHIADAVASALYGGVEHPAERAVRVLAQVFARAREKFPSAKATLTEAQEEESLNAVFEAIEKPMEAKDEPNVFAAAAPQASATARPFA